VGVRDPRGDHGHERSIAVAKQSGLLARATGATDGERRDQACAAARLCSWIQSAQVTFCDSLKNLAMSLIKLIINPHNQGLTSTTRFGLALTARILFLF
jgi:hypothetical protein